jgi:hypothetical protein
MKEHPILFSTPMVQAILEGRKTQTRRVVEPQPRLHDENNWPWKMTEKEGPVPYDCYFGQPGDRLWVRETFSNYRGFAEDVKPIAPLIFKADKDECDQYPCDLGDEIVYVSQREPWKPSIHMPKAAARIWLEVEEVRVERLHTISMEDAIAEGIHVKYWGGDKTQPYAYRPTVPTEPLATDYDRKPEESFQKLWQSINGGESWEANPWVWVIKFKVLSTTGKPETLNFKPL